MVICQGTISFVKYFNYALYFVKVPCQDTSTFMTAALIHCYLTGKGKYGPQIPPSSSSGLMRIIFHPVSLIRTTHFRGLDPEVQ